MSIVIEQENIIVALEPPREVVAQVEPDGGASVSVVVGVQGPPGAAGGRYTKVAGQDLSGQRVVIVGDDERMYYASASSPSHAARVVGVTAHAALEGADITVVAAGEMMEPGWSWTIGIPIFLGENGQLAQSAPQTGFVLRIGIPLSATRMLVALGEPILLT